MMLWEGFLLGLIQGLTEFLPVSSSGHLVIGQTLFGLRDLLAFDIFVHGATMLAIVVYFRRQVLGLLGGRSPSYVGKLALGTVPAVIVGLSFREAIRWAFDSPALVVGTLGVTGAALLSLGFVPRSRRQSQETAQPAGAPSPAANPAPAGSAEPSWVAAWWIGCAQAFAILPGISRSGSTIVAGIWLGLAPAAAAEFSFLLGIPAIAGAIVLQAWVVGWGSGSWLSPPFVAGAVAAFLSGLMAIFLVFRLLSRGEFRWFGLYCWVAAAAFGLWLWAR
jgi:undecaprenyl-diphosphatase